MDKIKQNLLLALLITFSFTSSLSLVLQTYDYRDSFSKLDQLKLEKQDLYFKESKIIEEGEYANITLFNPDLEWTFTADNIRSKSTNTPFVGTKLKGKALAVFNNRQFKEC